MSTATISEYERKRNERVARNEERLRSLGLLDPIITTIAKSTKSKASKQPKEVVTPTRRSRRRKPDVESTDLRNSTNSSSNNNSCDRNVSNVARGTELFANKMNVDSRTRNDCADNETSNMATASKAGSAVTKDDDDDAIFKTYMDNTVTTFFDIKMTNWPEFFKKMKIHYSDRKVPDQKEMQTRAVHLMKQHMKKQRQEEEKKRRSDSSQSCPNAKQRKVSGKVFGATPKDDEWDGDGSTTTTTEGGATRSNRWCSDGKEPPSSDALPMTTKKRVAKVTMSKELEDQLAKLIEIAISVRSKKVLTACVRFLVRYATPKIAPELVKIFEQRDDLNHEKPANWLKKLVGRKKGQLTFTEIRKIHRGKIEKGKYKDDISIMEEINVEVDQKFDPEAIYVNSPPDIVTKREPFPKGTRVICPDPDSEEEDNWFEARVLKSYKNYDSKKRMYCVKFIADNKEIEVDDTHVCDLNDYRIESQFEHKKSSKKDKRLPSFYVSYTGDEYARVTGWYVCKNNKIFLSIAEAYLCQDEITVKEKGNKTEKEDLILAKKWILRPGAKPVSKRDFDINMEGDTTHHEQKMNVCEGDLSSIEDPMDSGLERNGGISQPHFAKADVDHGKPQSLLTNNKYVDKNELFTVRLENARNNVDTCDPGESEHASEDANLSMIDNDADASCDYETCGGKQFRLNVNASTDQFDDTSIEEPAPLLDTGRVLKRFEAMKGNIKRQLKKLIDYVNGQLKRQKETVLEKAASMADEEDMINDALERLIESLQSELDTVEKKMLNLCNAHEQEINETLGNNSEPLLEWLEGATGNLLRNAVNELSHFPSRVRSALEDEHQSVFEICSGTDADALKKDLRPSCENIYGETESSKNMMKRDCQRYHEGVSKIIEAAQTKQNDLNASFQQTSPVEP